jgi:hypothetical protein
MQALFTLTSSESKRLLGKAVAAMPEVQQAKDNGYLVVGRGSTNAFILEEILGTKMDKERYVAGQVIKGVMCVLGAGLRTKPVIFHKGELLNVEPGTVVGKLTPGDILIKGANAVDPFGNVGIVMAGAGGGMMGQSYMALKAEGVSTIYPVGLEKLIRGRSGPVRREDDAGTVHRMPHRNGLRRGWPDCDGDRGHRNPLRPGGRPLRLRWLGGSGGLRHADCPGGRR